MNGFRVDELRNKALRVGAFSEISDVRLFSVNADFGVMPDEAIPFIYKFDSDVSVQTLPGDAGMIVNGEYELTVKQRVTAMESDGQDGDDPDLEREAAESVVATISFNMAALYSLDVPVDEESLTEEELDAFANTTGQFALHPYAREFIADVTGRMGLPQLHIGILKLHLDAPNPQ